MRAIVTVIGKDRVGIIADVTALLAQYGVNVLDISQTVLQEYFTMIMLVDAAQCTVPFADLARTLDEAGTQRGLQLRAQREAAAAQLLRRQQTQLTADHQLCPAVKSAAPHHAVGGLGEGHHLPQQGRAVRQIQIVQQR